MVAGVHGIPGLPAQVNVQRDSEYEADLATHLTELVAARETALKLNPANPTQSVSFDASFNSVMPFLATKKSFFIIDSFLKYLLENCKTLCKHSQEAYSM